MSKKSISPEAKASDSAAASTVLNTMLSRIAGSAHQLGSRTTVTVLSVALNEPNLKGPAVIGILLIQPVLNAAAVALADAGYSGENSNFQSAKFDEKVTTTSYGLLPCATFETCE